jgi:hypothetical protein
MNDEYEGLTPIETPDEMRERYARLEQETIAGWSAEQQALQSRIDDKLLNPIVAHSTVEELIAHAKTWQANQRQQV